MGLEQIKMQKTHIVTKIQLFLDKHFPLVASLLLISWVLKKLISTIFASVLFDLIEERIFGNFYSTTLSDIIPRSLYVMITDSIYISEPLSYFVLFQMKITI